MSGKEEPEKFKPTFENGGFWEYYKDLERQFENFLEYVPYLKWNKATYSFRLASLILSIGAHIDSAFKEVAKYPDFSKKYPDLLKKVTRGKTTINDYYVLAKSYRLSEREVTFKCLPERVTIHPFKDYGKKGERVKTPYWWRAYNKVKHEFSDNFQKATLKAARDALAGAFIINACHVPSAVRLCEYGLLKSEIRTPQGRVKGTYATPPPKQLEEMLKRGDNILGLYVETTLFIYDYSQ